MSNSLAITILALTIIRILLYTLHRPLKCIKDGNQVVMNHRIICDSWISCMTKIIS